MLTAANEVLDGRARSVTDLIAAVVRALGERLASLASALEDAGALAGRYQGLAPRPATLAGVAATSLDLRRVATAEADVMRVVAQATDGLRARVNVAVALAGSARSLLGLVGGRALASLRARREALDDHLNEATLPVLPAGQPSLPELAAALERLTHLEEASRDVLAAAGDSLEKTRKDNATRWNRPPRPGSCSGPTARDRRGRPPA